MRELKLGLEKSTSSLVVRRALSDARARKRQEHRVGDFAALMPKYAIYPVYHIENENVPEKRMTVGQPDAKERVSA